MQENLGGVGLNEQKTHQQLRIVSGDLKGQFQTPISGRSIIMIIADVLDADGL